MASKEQGRPFLDTPEMIDRLATEMRARTGGELLAFFYVDQVKRQLAGKSVATSAANRRDGAGKSGARLGFLRLGAFRLTIGNGRGQFRVIEIGAGG